MHNIVLEMRTNLHIILTQSDASPHTSHVSFFVLFVFGLSRRPNQRYMEDTHSGSARFIVTRVQNNTSKFQ